MDDGQECGIGVDSVAYDGRDEAEQPHRTVFRPHYQRQRGQRREASDQRHGPGEGQKQDDLAPAKDVEVLQRTTDGEVLDHRKPEHRHHRYKSKRQREAKEWNSL